MDAARRYALRSDNFTFYVDPDREGGRLVDRETGLPVELRFRGRLLRAAKAHALPLRG